jgi:hypothetical protein
MDNSDLAAAALRPDHTGKCNCSRNTKLGKPSKTCKKCKGTGRVTACADCEGSGWNKNSNSMCRKCVGCGYI